MKNFSDKQISQIFQMKLRKEDWNTLVIYYEVMTLLVMFSK